MISKALLLLVPALALAGCATTEEWAAEGGNREQGIVEVSYEYPEFQQSIVDEAQAQQIARSRCNVWGYAHADFIPGQVRECSSKDGGNCTFWKVTRLYQCSGDAQMADRAAGEADGSVSARLTPSRLAR
jgi:hypothetical protein